MRVAPQSSQASTWPPSAAVRQATMALHDAPLGAADAPFVRAAIGIPVSGGKYPPPPSPWTRDPPIRPGGTTSNVSRSSGLSTFCRISLFETRVIAAPCSTGWHGPAAPE